MGWIKVDRKLFENPMWLEEPFTKGQAWLDLIAMANFKDEKTIYKGKMIRCERGTVNRSISFLSRRWRWGWEKTRNFLSALESDNMICVNATTNRTTITLVNYGKYQNHPRANPRTNRERTESEPVNERIKEKNVKKGIKREGQAPRSQIPTLDEVIKHAEETGASSDPEVFFRYYDDRQWKLTGGLPVTDWKKTFATWEAREPKDAVKLAQKKYGNHPKQWEGYDDLTDELFGR